MNAAFRRLTIALLIPLLNACGIAMDSAPRDVPVSERILPLGVDTASFDTSGSSLIYLVAVGDDRLLRSVRRDSETQSELLGIASCWTHRRRDRCPTQQFVAAGP